MPANKSTSGAGKWKMREECGESANSLGYDDVKDIIACFFFTKRFTRAGDAWDFTTPDGVQIDFPKFKVPWASNNKGFITDRNLLIKASRVTGDSKTVNKARKIYWERWFASFGHPLIYVEYERLILHTEFDYRLTEIQLSDESQENKNKKSTDSQAIDIIYNEMLTSFCKARTRFIRCMTETIKPSYFCSGPYSKLPKDAKAKVQVIKLVKALGYTTIHQDMVDFAGNGSVHPSISQAKKRKERYNKLEGGEDKTLDEQIATQRELLSALLQEKSIETELEEDLDDTPVSSNKKKEPQTPTSKVDSLIKKAADEVIEETVNHEKEKDDKDDEEPSTKQEFGKRTARQAINSVSTVLARWNMGSENRKDAIKLYKMYEYAQFKQPRSRQILRRTMLRARPLF
ncbi:MAG: hypothetical protein CMM25_01315 [Rhodospirillaceae bacterium]|nr:hypothetical protein [Rhodospirillaceae bacterium]|tara:strand:- start:170 stop:1375 length:1206 start_codon:yes stop_codon:yes gene_type:complete